MYLIKIDKNVEQNAVSSSQNVLQSLSVSVRYAMEKNTVAKKGTSQN